jgi:hypothetical protein
MMAKKKYLHLSGMKPLKVPGNIFKILTRNKKEKNMVLLVGSMLMNSVKGNNLRFKEICSLVPWSRKSSSYKKSHFMQSNDYTIVIRTGIMRVGFQQIIMRPN